LKPSASDGRGPNLAKAIWKPASGAESAAKAAGCEVRKSKTEGYEVYGLKNGKLFELFYSPKTNDRQLEPDPTYRWLPSAARVAGLV
jgi:hypothetical protein